MFLDFLFPANVKSLGGEVSEFGGGRTIIIVYFRHLVYEDFSREILIRMERKKMTYKNLYSIFKDLYNDIPRGGTGENNIFVLSV